METGQENKNFRKKKKVLQKHKIERGDREREEERRERRGGKHITEVSEQLGMSCFTKQG